MKWNKDCWVLHLVGNWFVLDWWCTEPWTWNVQRLFEYRVGQKGFGIWLFKVLSQYFPRETEENYKHLKLRSCRMWHCVVWYVQHRDVPSHQTFKLLITVERTWNFIRSLQCCGQDTNCKPPEYENLTFNLTSHCHISEYDLLILWSFERTPDSFNSRMIKVIIALVVKFHRVHLLVIVRDRCSYDFSFFGAEPETYFQACVG
jgi:hypothetical protein